MLVYMFYLGSAEIWYIDFIWPVKNCHQKILTKINLPICHIYGLASTVIRPKLPKQTKIKHMILTICYKLFTSMSRYWHSALYFSIYLCEKGLINRVAWKQCLYREKRVSDFCSICFPSLFPSLTNL